LTPLAHQVLKQLVLPAKRRTFDDLGDVLPLLDDVRYFDCRAISQIGRDLTYDANFGKLKEATAFLPSPKTWIEMKEFGIEIGVLLVASPNEVSVKFVIRGGPLATASMWWDKFQSRPFTLTFDIVDGLFDLTAPRLPDGLSTEDRLAIPLFLRSAAGCLALINSPRTIARTEKLPHAGLQRDLVQKFKGKGEFRLHPWTQILLQISPRSSDQPASDPRDVHLSGAKALHFVRKYLRISRGRLQTVSEHWKGDAALGIKQSTYRVLPESGVEQE
jgi:hypothetical protein